MDYLLSLLDFSFILHIVTALWEDQDTSGMKERRKEKSNNDLILLIYFPVDNRMYTRTKGKLKFCGIISKSYNRKAKGGCVY